MRDQKRQWMLFVSLMAVLLSSTKVQAVEEGDDYETIVSHLSSSTNRAPLAKPKQDLLSEAEIHGSVGFANSFSAVRTAGGQRLRSHLQGIQAGIGIDLLSKNWMAEGTARSFSDYSVPNARLSLKEFDLKIIYKTRFAERLGVHVGTGLAARYMKVAETVAATAPAPASKASDGNLTPNATTSTDIESEYTTPASVSLVGLDAFLTDKVSLGAEASYRSALISETIDHVSYDVLFRLDAHF